MSSNLERKLRAKALMQKTRLKTKKASLSHKRQAPSANINKPIENPKLKKSLSAFTNNKNHTTWRLLQKELNQASYLIPFLDDEVVTSPTKNDNTVTFETGSLIKFINCTNDRGEPFIPAFSDWDEIRKWTTDHVASWVMSPADLWDFALQQNGCKGVVINRAGTLLALEEEHIKALKKQL